MSQMMIQINNPRCRALALAVGGTGEGGQVRQRVWRVGGGVLAGVVLLAGCAAGHPGPGHALPRPGRARPAAAEAGSLVRVPCPDYAGPASVAAASCTAWSGVDAVYDSPLSFAAGCAPLAPGALAGQLVSLVRVRAATRPAAAPAPAVPVAYLRACASWVTVTTSGHASVSGGVTVQATRTGRRWLVSAALSW